jgi:hypothetical protein
MKQPFGDGASPLKSKGIYADTWAMAAVVNMIAANWINPNRRMLFMVCVVFWKRSNVWSLFAKNTSRKWIFYPPGGFFPTGNFRVTNIRGASNREP